MHPYDDDPPHRRSSRDDDYPGGRDDPPPRASGRASVGRASVPGPSRSRPDDGGYGSDPTYGPDAGYGPSYDAGYRRQLRRRPVRPDLRPASAGGREPVLGQPYGQYDPPPARPTSPCPAAGRGSRRPRLGAPDLARWARRPRWHGSGHGSGGPDGSGRMGPGMGPGRRCPGPGGSRRPGGPWVPAARVAAVPADPAARADRSGRSAAVTTTARVQDEGRGRRFDLGGMLGRRRPWRREEVHQGAVAQHPDRGLRRVHHADRRRLRRRHLLRGQRCPGRRARLPQDDDAVLRRRSGDGQARRGHPVPVEVQRDERRGRSRRWSPPRTRRSGPTRASTSPASCGPPGTTSPAARPRVGRRSPSSTPGWPSTSRARPTTVRSARRCWPGRSVTSSPRNRSSSTT